MILHGGGMSSFNIYFIFLAKANVSDDKISNKICLTGINRFLMSFFVLPVTCPIENWCERHPNLTNQFPK